MHLTQISVAARATREAARIALPSWFAKVPPLSCTRPAAVRSIPHGEILSMEYHISLNPMPSAIEAIEQSLRALDPSALVDVDPLQPMLRVATMLESADVMQQLEQAGFPINANQLYQVPSICCGGCSG